MFMATLPVKKFLAMTRFQLNEEQGCLAMSNESAIFKKKVHHILSLTYHGLYNVPGKIKYDELFIEVSVTEGLSTFDFDKLTRLVVGAHDLCVRLVIKASGPRLVKLYFTSGRNRTGLIQDRHPTIEEAIEQIRSLGVRPQDRYTETESKDAQGN